jgi:tellurite resistance protein
MLLSAVVSATLLLLYVLKWLLARDEALGEVAHPVQCCFVGLIGVATMLVAGGALPYSRLTAEILFAAGVTFTLLFAIWRTGGLWLGERDHTATTAVMYLPTVAGSFVAAATAGALGYPDWGQYAFGAGVFSWLAIESVLLHRLLVEKTLPPALRPTLGIQLAPAPVGAIAYLSVTQGPADIVVHAMLGYGMLQAAVLIRLIPWIRKQPFVLSYWAFTFGATALALAPLRLIERGDTGPALLLAPVLFVTANIVVGAIGIGSVWLAIRGWFPSAAGSKEPDGSSHPDNKVVVLQQRTGTTDPTDARSA